MLRLVATRELISDMGEERSLTPREDKGIVMGLIGWDGVLG